MQPTDSYPQDHLSHSQSRYQVFNFNKVIDFATTIDRVANNGLAGMSMVPILLSDKYVTIKGMGGMSRHNLRIGDFKSFHFKEGIPDFLSSWILYCASRMGNSAIHRGSVLEGYNTRGREIYPNPGLSLELGLTIARVHSFSTPSGCNGVKPVENNTHLHLISNFRGSSPIFIEILIRC